MRTQKAISVRLDITSENWLNNIVLQENTPKNRLINEAVRLYVRVKQSRMRAIMSNHLDEWDDAALKIDARWGNWR